MKPFKYERPNDAGGAVAAVLPPDKQAKYLAGGTNLLDLMKEGVENPATLVDISKLNLSQIKATTNGGISIGALAKNTDTANHPLVRQGFPLLSQAILAGASAQIRNMATNGGNLLQRTRCNYFYDVAMPCNKRNPGSGCGALEGLNRNHAIFGWSEKCVATYPSDMSIALAALDAKVKVLRRGGGEISIPILEFHRLPGDTPEKDNNLQHGDLITAIELPPISPAFVSSYYLKVRDRASYAFALVSVAVILHLKGGKTAAPSRVVLGGVAHKPWRSTAAEEVLNGGKIANEDLFKRAAEAAMKEAKPLKHNAYKIELGKRAIVRALQRATGAV